MDWPAYRGLDRRERRAGRLARGRAASGSLPPPPRHLLGACRAISWVELSERRQAAAPAWCRQRAWAEAERQQRQTATAGHADARGAPRQGAHASPHRQLPGCSLSSFSFSCTEDPSVIVKTMVASAGTLPVLPAELPATIATETSPRRGTAWRWCLPANLASWSPGRTGAPACAAARAAACGVLLKRTSTLSGAASPSGSGHARMTGLCSSSSRVAAAAAAAAPPAAVAGTNRQAASTAKQIRSQSRAIHLRSRGRAPGEEKAASRYSCTRQQRAVRLPRHVSGCLKRYAEQPETFRAPVATKASRQEAARLAAAQLLPMDWSCHN